VWFFSPSQTNDIVFKASNHKYKLKWTGGTTAQQENVHEMPDVDLKFKPFAKIVAGRWRLDLLIRKFFENLKLGYVYHFKYLHVNKQYNV